VTTSFFIKDALLVTADLTAKEWGPFAELITNICLEAKGPHSS
jgi:hypothetical protein